MRGARSVVTSFGPGGLAVLALVVFFGAVVPVVPTGAAVSAASALAFGTRVLDLPGVLLAGALGAYLGDLTVYGACRAGGERLAQRMRWTRGGPARMRAVRARLEEHQLTTLLLSRLVPGGRVPVLLAAGVAGYPWRRFAATDVTACLLWSAVYGAIGIIGGAIFPHPWQGVVAAVVLVLVITVVVGRVRRPDAEPADR